MGNIDLPFFFFLKGQLILLNFKAQMPHSWLLVVDGTDYCKLKTTYVMANALGGPPA